MWRTTVVFALLVLSMPAYPTEGIAMWGCAPEGQRRNVLYLADRGARSYVKVGTQRASARLVATQTERTWSFGTTTVVLTPDDFANYIENGTVKSRFKCKLM